MPQSNLRCDACDASVSIGYEQWHLVCCACGLERSTLNPHINEIHSIDEIKREMALKPLRDHNFDILLKWLKGCIRDHSGFIVRKKLLDVGCAHGWFIEKAGVNFDVLGLEPDDAVASRARQRNLPVRKGYFPEALKAGEIFDVIVFNDVLEHIPDVKNVLKECAARLSDDGVVVINAPDSRGLLYRLSKLLTKAGRIGAFHRMWQVGLPSPHLYYFDRGSMNKIALASGFRVSAERQLPSILSGNLYERIYCAGNVSKLRSAIITGGILMLIPFLKVFRSDISVWVLAKSAA